MKSATVPPCPHARQEQEDFSSYSWSPSSSDPESSKRHVVVQAIENRPRLPHSGQAIFSSELELISFWCENFSWNSCGVMFQIPAGNKPEIGGMLRERMLFCISFNALLPGLSRTACSIVASAFSYSPRFASMIARSKNPLASCGSICWALLASRSAIGQFLFSIAITARLLKAPTCCESRQMARK